MKTYLTSEVIWRQKKPMYGAGIEPMTSCATPLLPTDALFCLTPAGLLTTPCRHLKGKYKHRDPSSCTVLINAWVLTEEHFGLP